VNGTYLVYGAAGSGAVPIEVALSLLGLPYRVEHHAPWESPRRAAILIWLADLYPHAGLAPSPNSAARPGYPRWMRRVDADPRLAMLRQSRVPFVAGWEP